MLPVLGPSRTFSRISRIFCKSESKSYSAPIINASAMATADSAANKPTFSSV